MAGRGPAPKANKIRRNADPVEGRVIQVHRAEQPALPDVPGHEWPAATVEWWSMWGRSPLADNFTENDWSELLDAALLHARVWGDGELKHLPELRLRVAKYGATPEDRARLRITFAQADEADEKRTMPQPESQARQRRGPLKAV